LKKIDRRGRILLDWLRNGLGATAVASFCPRARPNATVATPLGWDEVTKKLDPQTFTLHSVPERLAKLRSDPWQGFYELKQSLPDVAMQQTPTRRGSGTRAGRAVIVTASKPKRRAQV
jgi:bifunctional non-homologous end joining protein LigD